MKFSAMSYTFARQPAHFDLRRMLEFAARHLDGIDLVTLHDRPAKELRARCDDLGLAVVCHTFIATGLASPDPAERQRGLDECQRGLEAAVTLGAPVAMIPTMGDPSVPRGQWRRQWIDGLRQAAPFAADAGVVLTVENFPGEDSAFVLAADFREAQGEIPALRLTYDNGNAATGEDPADSFRQCADAVVHAHFKDWEVAGGPAPGYRRMLDGRHYRPALIGEGVVDHRACLRAMAEASYGGFVNLEYEGERYDPFEATRRAVDHLRGIAAELGAERGAA